MALQTKKTPFGIEGFRAMRNNPDGTNPTASRFIGFTNTVDLSDIGTDLIGTLTLKIDGGAAESKSVDFSGASDITAVTVAEAVSALTTAAFTNITWSNDATTSRLKGVASSGTYIQVYGELAPLLDFGQGVLHGGQGLVFVKAFDNTASIGLPKNIKAREEIELESGDGTLSTMIIEAINKGLNPAIVINDDDYDLKELIQGGTYDRTANTYDPKTTDTTSSPIFWLDVYAPIYAKGTKHREDLAGYKRTIIRSVTGVEGDVTHETKAWATTSYNLSAVEYYDENGTKYASYQEQTPTVAQFTALDPENV